jgi:hypothetical protein
LAPPVSSPTRTAFLSFLSFEVKIEDAEKLEPLISTKTFL